MEAAAEMLSADLNTPLQLIIKQRNSSMASMQMVDRTARRRGNSGHVPSGTIQEPLAPADRPLTDDLLPAISEAAYFRAQARGFEPGHEMEDWIAAEHDVIARHYPVGDAARV